MSIACTLHYQADLNRGIEPTRMTRLLASGDQEAHCIEVEIVQGGRPVDLTGVSVSGCFLRADDTMVLLSGTASGNIVQLILPQACYRVNGVFSLAVKLTKDTKVSTVFWGNGSITQVDSDTVVDPEGQIPSLSELLARMDEVTRATAAATTAANSATTAASEANAAKDKANTAANAATSAASGANTAKTQAANATAEAATAAAQATEASAAAANAAAGANAAAQRVDEAIQTAQTAAAQANAAQANASTAAERAAEAAAMAKPWGNVEISVTMLGPQETPLVVVSDTKSGKQMTFRLPQGLTGATPALTIGTVTTGEPDSDARAWLTGTAEAPVLNLSIPAGKMGAIENLTVCGVAPDGGGKITLTAENVGALPADGTAASANALRDAHTIQVDLGSSSGAAFNGTRDIKPGVSGVLGIGNGGTGAQTASQALANLGGAYEAGMTLPWDSSTRMLRTGRIMANGSILYVEVSTGKPFHGVPKLTSFAGVVYSDGKTVSMDTSNDSVSCSIQSYHGELGIIYIQINSTLMVSSFQDNSVVGVVITDLGISFMDR